MKETLYRGAADDACAALVAVASAVSRFEVAPGDRDRYLAAVARALRHHDGTGTVELRVADSTLRVTVGTDGATGSAGDPATDGSSGPPPDTASGTAQGAASGTAPDTASGTAPDTASGTAPDTASGTAPDTATVLSVPVRADAAAAGPGDGDATAFLDHLIEQHSALESHRLELEQTNKGVLALHAELAENAERLRRASELQGRSLRAERTARAAAEAARSQLAFLAHAGATLSESLDHATVLDRLRALIVPRYASTMRVWLSRSGGVLDPFPPAAAGARPSPLVEKAYVSGRVQHTTHLPVTDAGGGPDVDTTPGTRPALAIPLISRGITLGVLSIEPGRAPFADENIVVFRELGRLTAAAMDNALRYEYERDVAERLQRAMLTDLPQAGRLRFCARYLPAEAGLNIGGDWYDAFERPDGDVIAAVGDVTGHGLQAAALMGQLRTAMRSYAIDATGPGEVLTRMHRMLSHLQPEDLATAVLAQMSPNGELRWANAGHPPPLLRGPDGDVTIMDGHDFLLGMPFESAALREHRALLAPGSSVIFYTDGLIERRGVRLDTGIDRLAEAFGAADGDLDVVADRVVDAMLSDSAREDDTCVLIFRAETGRQGIEAGSRCAEAAAAE